MNNKMTLFDWRKALLLLLVIFATCEYAGRGLAGFWGWFGRTGSYLAWTMGGALWLLGMAVVQGDTNVHERKDQYRWETKQYFASAFFALSAVQ